MREDPRSWEARTQWAILAALTWAVGVVTSLAPALSPRLSWDGDVINRAVVEGYAKEREIALYLCACVTVPLVCAAFVRATRTVRTPVAGLAIASLAAWPLLLTAGLSRGLAVALSGALAVATLLASRRERPPQRPPAREPPEFGGNPVVLGVILASGAGLCAVLPLGGARDFPTLRLLSLAGLGLGTTLSAGAWYLLRTLFPSRGRPSATWALFPWGALALANANPASPAWRLLVGGVALGASAGLFFLQRRGGGPIPPRVVWWAWVPMVLYWTCFVRDTSGPIDLYHEGERITPAAAVAEGAIPYRDVFLWHGLVENGLLPQLGLWIHCSVAGARAVQAVVAPLGTVSLYALLSSLLGGPLPGFAATLASAYLLPPPNPRYWPLLLAVACLVVWLRRGQGRWLSLAGCATAAAVFWSLDGGTTAAVAAVTSLPVGMWVWRNRPPWSWLLRFSAGFVVVASLPVAYLLAHGALDDFVSTSLSIVGGLSDRSSRPFPPLAPRGGMAGPLAILESKAGVLYLPAFAILLGLAHLGGWWDTSRVTPRVALPLLTASAAFFRAVIRRPDVDHVTKILPLVYATITLLGWVHVHRLRRSGWAMLPSAITLVPLALLMWGTVRVDPETSPARLVALRAHVPLWPGLRRVNLPRAGPGVLAEPGTAAWLERLVPFVQTHVPEGEPFFDFTNSGLLYFLADRPSPTRYVQTTYAASRSAQREVIARLSATRPRLVLFPSDDDEKYGYDWLLHPFRHPLIARYLYTSYRPWTMVDDTIVLTRRRPGEGPVPETVASIPFNAWLGALPMLLSRQPAQQSAVRRWEGAELAQWTPVPPCRATWEPDRTTLWLEGRHLGLVSPPLHIQPDPWHRVVVEVHCATAAPASLTFTSRLPSGLDRDSTIRYTCGAGVRRYAIDVGVSPAWNWGGPVCQLLLSFGDGACPVGLRSVALVRLAED